MNVEDLMKKDTGPVWQQSENKSEAEDKKKIRAEYG
jgi:hypothetical protein